MSEQAIQAPEATTEVQLAVTSLFTERAVFSGHQLAVTHLNVDNEHNTLVSGSRDCSALVWKLPKTQESWAAPMTRLEGHNHFVSSVSFSTDASHLLTSSWDGTIRLWDVPHRSCKTLFRGHEKDVLQVAFSPCNRRIISVSRDKTVKLWNILGKCMSTLPGDSWATCVACAPIENQNDPLHVAVGFWDGKVIIYEINEKFEVKHTIKAHEGRCEAISFTPDGKWVISGGSDRKVCMFQTHDGQKSLSFTAQAPVHAIATCPTQAWICAATYAGIHVWDISTKQMIDNVNFNFVKRGEKRDEGRKPDCTSLAWAADGTVMYAGYNDGNIRAWEVRSQQ